jgi:hypothetical protein
MRLEPDFHYLLVTLEDHASLGLHLEPSLLGLQLSGRGTTSNMTARIWWGLVSVKEAVRVMPSRARRSQSSCTSFIA